MVDRGEGRRVREVDGDEGWAEDGYGWAGEGEERQEIEEGIRSLEKKKIEKIEDGRRRIVKRDDQRDKRDIRSGSEENRTLKAGASKSRSVICLRMRKGYYFEISLNQERKWRWKLCKRWNDKQKSETDARAGTWISKDGARKQVAGRDRVGREGMREDTSVDGLWTRDCISLSATERMNYVMMAVSSMSIIFSYVVLDQKITRYTTAR